MRTLLRSAEVWTAAILSVMAAGAAILYGPGPVLWGVLAGGGVGWLNTEGIVRLVGRLQATGAQRSAWIALLLPVKLLALAALAYWLVRVVGVDGIGFLAGVSGALLALVVAARRLAARAPATRS